LPIFVLSLELGKSVWRHVHAAKALVTHNILEEASEASFWMGVQPRWDQAAMAQIRVICLLAVASCWVLIVHATGPASRALSHGQRPPEEPHPLGLGASGGQAGPLLQPLNPSDEGLEVLGMDARAVPSVRAKLFVVPSGTRSRAMSW
jgi:hypothetical protein